MDIGDAINSKEKLLREHVASQNQPSLANQTNSWFFILIINNVHIWVANVRSAGTLNKVLNLVLERVQHKLSLQYIYQELALFTQDNSACAVAT